MLFRSCPAFGARTPPSLLVHPQGAGADPHQPPQFPLGQAEAFPGLPKPVPEHPFTPLSSIVPEPRRKNNPWSVDYPDTRTAEKRRLTAEEICGTLELRTNVLFLRGSPSPKRSTNPAGVLPLRRQGGNSAGSVSPGRRKDAPPPAERDRPEQRRTCEDGSAAVGGGVQ